MGEYSLRISLRKNLHPQEYQKLVEFLGSDKVEYKGHKLLEIIEGNVGGNPPIVRDIVIGVYKERASEGKEFAERVRDATKGLVDLLCGLGALQ